MFLWLKFDRIASFYGKNPVWKDSVSCDSLWFPPWAPQRNWAGPTEGVFLSVFSLPVRHLASGWKGAVGGRGVFGSWVMPTRFFLSVDPFHVREVESFDGRTVMTALFVLSGWRADFMLPHPVQPLLPWNREEHLCGKVISERKTLAHSGSGKKCYLVIVFLQSSNIKMLRWGGECEPGLWNVHGDVKKWNDAIKIHDFCGRHWWMHGGEGAT